MAIQYAPLFALETQFQTKDGRNNTGGWLKVFLAATDDPATTYSDYNGTRNPEKIVLDDDGRALVICDKSKAYRLEVYSMDGTLLWTEEPVYCSGTGGGGVSITKVVSTDGSISVDENVAGSTTTYDLGIANSSDEFLEWIKCSENECGATWYPVFNDGSMETEAGKGIKVHGGHLYHFTNSFTVDPDGTGVNYDTFRVAMYCGNDIVDEHDFDIDSSLNDPVLCEFSRDVVPSKDTHVYFKLTIPSTCKVSGEVQCHRIYSGINAVPDTCATKQWVSGSYQPLSGMSSYVPYSSVGNNSVGQVTGINGSAIVGGLDSASVSSIASSVASAYTESAFSSLSSKADSSALSSYQPVSAMGAYATTAYVDGRVSGKLDTTAFNSGNFYPTSNPSGFITGVDLGNYATTGFVESAVSGKLDTSAFASASAGFAPAGDYAFNSSLGLYIPVSASGAFQPRGDYAFNSAVSSKLDASASDFFVMYSSMTSWIPYSALGYSGTSISSIGGSSLAGMGGGGVTGDYVEKSATEVAIGSRVTAFDTAFAQGANCSASARSFSQGRNNTATKTSFSQGFDNTATKTSFAQGYNNSAQDNSLTQGYGIRATSTSFAQGVNNTATNNSFAQGNSNTASSNSLTQGHNNTATNASFVQGSWNSATNDSLAQGYSNTATDNSFVQGEYNSANSYSFAQGIFNSASSHSFAQGNRNSAAYTAAVFGSFNLHGNGNTASGDSAAFAIGDGTAHSARHDLMLVTKNGEITMYSSTADTVGLGLVSSIKAISASATGGVDSATVSAIASAYTTGKLDSSAQVVTATATQPYDGIAYMTSVNGAPVSASRAGAAEMALNANYAWYDSAGRFIPSLPDSAAVSAIASAYTTGKQDTLAFAYNSANQISSINGSAIGGMDEAAVSAIASSYSQSAASSKLDTTAFNSGDFYSTSNPSGFVGNAYVDSAVSGKLDSSAFNSGDFYSTSNPSGFVDSTYVNSAVSGKLDTSAFNSGDFYTTANESGFVDSTYVNSAVSGKLDTSAFNSGDFYSTSNPSGFITGVDLTPYQPTSAMSGYIPTSMSSDFQQVAGMSSYALSADVSATVDLVSTQSANWGGSALQLSAGPGVSLTKSGNTLIAGLDETVLWSGNPSAYISSVTLPEPWSNFDRVRFYWNPHTDERCWTISEVPTNTDYIHLETVWLSNNASYKAVFGYAFSSTDHKSFTQYNGGFNNITGAANWTNSNECKVMKIVGINRTAGV